MIVISGANGQLGRAVAVQLLRHVAANQIVASVRELEKASTLIAQGVEVRAGDFADPASLRRAFAGAHQVLIISVNKLGDEALRLHRAAIDAAREAGVSRILYTSHMGARSGSPFSPADQHAGTEADLAESALPYTALRHGFYAESCLHMIGDALKTRELRVPEDGPVSWTARDDLAAADAAILAGRGQWDGITPPLTASRVWTMEQLALLASEIMGREIRHTVVPDGAWIDTKIAVGTPAPYAHALLGMFQAARRGDFAATNPLLKTLIGREPRSMTEIVEEFLLR